MTGGDIDEALALSRSEGWNQTKADWQFLAGNPANVCIVAQKDGRISGTATALIHDNKLAWIGMVLVDKSLRGLGAGRLLMEQLIKSLSGTESVKLDATPAGEPLYTKLGFIHEYRIFRMTLQGSDHRNISFEGPETAGIRSEDIDRINTIDTEAFGVNRSGLLKFLQHNYPEKGFYTEDDTGVTGFIHGRAGSKFTYVGPLTSVSDEAAIRLVSESVRFHSGETLALDVPEMQKGLINWLEKAGFVTQRYFTRMYLHHNPYPGSLKSQYLISGPEFG
jgi:GNAT superfamily N-acetyltransferase